MLKRSTLFFTCFLMLTAGGSGLSLAGGALQFDYKQLSSNPRGGGDGGAQRGKVEKILQFTNKCTSNARLRVVYLNRFGRHQIATTMAPGQRGSSSKSIHKAHTVIGGGCKKKPGNIKCTPYVDAKARKFKIRACK